MTGYCMNCQTMVPLINVRTDRLVNRQFIHKGTCVNCAFEIWVKVEDHELIVDTNGHFYPDKVFMDKKYKTNIPKRLFNNSRGQRVFIDGKESKKIKPIRDKLPKLDELIRRGKK